VCLSVSKRISGIMCPIFARFFVHVTYACDSVLLWRRSDTLCTSGFMDDVIFPHMPRVLDVVGCVYVLQLGDDTISTSCGEVMMLVSVCLCSAGVGLQWQSFASRAHRSTLRRF